MPNYATNPSNVGKTTSDVGLMNPYLEVGRPDEYGLFGKRDYQHDLQAAQYAAELQLMQYQNEFNSYGAQAQRMREAGANPDLLGVSGESAAGMQGVANPANVNAETPAETALGITSTVLSIFGGLADGTLSAMHKIEDFDQKRLEGFRKALGLAAPIGDSIGSYMGHIGDDIRPFMNEVDTFIKKAPRRYRSALRTYVSRYGLSNKYATGVSSGKTEARLANARNVATALDPLTQDTDADQLMKDLKPLKEAEFEVTKMLLENRKSEAEKMSAYWINKDMGLQAEMENSQARASKGEADIQETIRKGALKSIDFLEKHMEQGKWWASTALSAIYASLQGANLLPSISHGSSTQSRSNEHGTIENHSSSWNFGF